MSDTSSAATASAALPGSSSSPPSPITHPPRRTKTSWSAQEMAEGRIFTHKHSFVSPADGSPAAYPLGGPQVWEAEAASLVFDDGVSCITVTPDGSSLLAGTSTGIWQLAVPSLEKVGFVRTFAPVTCVDISSDGSMVAASCEDERSDTPDDWIHSVALFDLPLPSPPATDRLDAAGTVDYDRLVADAIATLTAGLQGSAGWSSAETSAMSPKLTSTLAEAVHAVAHRREIDAHRLISGSASGYRKALFSPDGKFLVVTNSNSKWSERGGVSIVDIASKRAVRLLEGHSDSVMFASFSPDGSLVATVCWDSTVCLWSAATGSLVRRLSLTGADEQQLWDAAFSPDGSRLAVGSGNAHVYVFDVGSGALVHKLGGFDRCWIRTVAFSPDGQTLAAGSASESFRLFDVAIGESRQWWKGAVANKDDPDVFPGGEEVRDAQWSRNGRRVAFSVTDGRTVVYEESTNRLWEMQQGPPGPTRVPGWGSTALAPDGTLLFSAHGRTLRLWRLGD